MPTDEALIAAYLAGEEEAFTTLVDRHLSSVYDFAFRLCGNTHEAEDIAQETFLKAWHNLKKYRSQSARVRTWLFTIARNTTVDHLRRRRSTALSEFERDDGSNYLTDTLPDTAPLPDEAFAEAENIEMLEEALEKLPVRAREVLILHFREELTFEEIGAILNEPLNTVKSRHRRALIALRKLVERHQNS
ncbi:MAG: sigma-70 family RNA polymerase sigma factor [Patescibacteria group bacterium]|nr:sigma-70 family RNA polymerase sigma factor [Patescibacteria group bacterium]